MASRLCCLSIAILTISTLTFNPCVIPHYPGSLQQLIILPTSRTSTGTKDRCSQNRTQISGISDYASKESSRCPQTLSFVEPRGGVTFSSSVTRVKKIAFLTTASLSAQQLLQRHSNHGNGHCFPSAFFNYVHIRVSAVLVLLHLHANYSSWLYTPKF